MTKEKINILDKPTLGETYFILFPKRLCKDANKYELILSGTKIQLSWSY